MNFIRTFLFAAALTLLAAIPPAWAQTAGTLDAAFNPIVSGANGYVNATVLQPDGKVVIGGNFTIVGGGGAVHTNIARLNDNGTVDDSFAPSTNDTVNSMAIQADGKIVLGGVFTTVNGTALNCIARLNADGSRDPAFDAGAVAGLRGANGVVYGVAVQADGKILLGGKFTSVNGSAVNTATGVKNIARLNRDGSRDLDFNASASGPSDSVYSVAVQADGKILLVGDFTSVNGSAVNTATGVNNIARLNRDGSRDTAFNVRDGAGLGGANLTVYSVAVQADGKILLGGNFTSVNGSAVNASTGVNRMARLNADGSRDTAFNASGGGANDIVYSVVVQADGKILLGGFFTSVNGSAVSSATGVNSIARLNPDGSRDTAFNGSGGAGLGGAYMGVKSVAVQANGKILLGGTFVKVNGTDRNLLARLNNDAATQTLTAPDWTIVQWNRGGAGPEVSQVTFEQSTDGGGTWTVLGSGTRIDTTSNWQLTGLSLPASGKVRARGRTPGSFGSGSSGLVQQVADFVAPAGSLATMFVPNISGGTQSVWATAVQPDGKIIIGGDFITVDGAPHANIARLNTDGGVDAEFTASTNGAVYSVVVQADGTILLGGAFTSVNGSTVNPTTGVNRIARLDGKGTRDPAFNANGSVGLGGANNDVRSVALQADGKILLGGAFTSVNGSAVSATTGVNRIARLNRDGSRDPAFNANGGVGLGGANNVVNSVAVQADGKILLGGFFTSVNGSAVSQTTGINQIARLDGEGRLDPNFKASGGGGGWVNSVAVQADGGILLAGIFTTNGSTVCIVRLDGEGRVDTNFNAGGKANEYASSVAVQADGKILLGGAFTSLNGSAVSTTSGVNFIARLNRDGSRDAAFNASGGVGLGGTNGVVNSIAVEADGKILPGGVFRAVNGASRPGLARLNNDAATQTLNVQDSTQVQWSRGGALPEVSQVIFEQSSDGGGTWTVLGSGKRIGITSNWVLTGLSLPANGQVRARGRTTGAFGSGSSGLVEQVAWLGALGKLEEGNRRYADGRLTHPNQSVERRKEVAGGQLPFAIIVGCSDSRVPPEVVFDQGLGDLFVIRIAGEVVDDSALGSIEYAVEHLHTGLIVVLGHERCGAVAAAVDAVEHGTDYEPHIETLVDAIKPAVEHVKGKPGDLLENSVKENAKEVAEHLRESEPVIKEEVEHGKVSIVSGYYDLESGLVTFGE